MIRVLAGNRTGTVILRDDREDGSYVLLECEEFEPSGGGGVVDLPEDEEFPMLRAVEKTQAHAERTETNAFALEVDISEMPPGELRFHNREFVEQAVERAQEQSTKITPGDADQWGYIDDTRPARL